MTRTIQPNTSKTLDICHRAVLRKNLNRDKTECFFTDGTSILVSNFLGSFVRPGDELLFPLEFQPGGVGAPIYIRNINTQERRQDTFQAEIGYATQPKKGKRGNLYISADVVGGCLGISAI